MGTVLTESESFDLLVEGPTTATVSDSAEMRANMTKLLNRDRWMIERAYCIHPTVASSSNWVRVPMKPLELDATDYQIGQSGGPSNCLGWENLDATAPGTMFFEVHLPVTKGIIKGFYGRIVILTGHAGTDPPTLTPPKLELWRNDWEIDAITSIASGSCVNTSTAAYEGDNNILVTGLSESFAAPEPSGPTNGERSYFLGYTSDFGVDADVNKVFLLNMSVHIAQS